MWFSFDFNLEPRILIQGHWTPFDKRHSLGNSNVIYDRVGGGGGGGCVWGVGGGGGVSDAYHTPPLLNKIFLGSKCKTSVYVTFRWFGKEEKKWEREKYETKSAIWIGSACNIHLK